MSNFNYIPFGIAAFLLIAVFSICSIIFGASYLDVILPGGLPLGNVLAASIFFGFSGAAQLLAKGRRVLRIVTTAVVAISLMWLPISIALAGNVTLNFSGELGTVWLWFSGCLFFIVIGTFLLAAGAALYSRRTLTTP